MTLQKRKTRLFQNRPGSTIAETTHPKTWNRVNPKHDAWHDFIPPLLSDTEWKEEVTNVDPDKIRNLAKKRKKEKIPEGTRMVITDQYDLSVPRKAFNEIKKALIESNMKLAKSIKKEAFFWGYEWIFRLDKSKGDDKKLLQIAKEIRKSGHISTLHIDYLGMQKEITFRKLNPGYDIDRTGGINFDSSKIDPWL